MTTPTPTTTLAEYLLVLNTAIGDHFVATCPSTHRGYAFFFTGLKQTQVSDAFIGQVVAHNEATGESVYTPFPGCADSAVTPFTPGTLLTAEHTETLPMFLCEVGEGFAKTVAAQCAAMTATIDRLLSHLDSQVA